MRSEAKGKRVHREGIFAMHPLSWCGFGDQAIRRSRWTSPFFQGRGKEMLLHAVLVGLDHLLDHLTADRTGLTGSQIAVVTLLQVDAHLP